MTFDFSFDKRYKKIKRFVLTNDKNIKSLILFRMNSPKSVVFIQYYVVSFHHREILGFRNLSHHPNC